MLRTMIASVMVCLSLPVWAWDVSTSTSPVDDSVTVTATVEADGTYQNNLGEVGRAVLQVSCEQNTTIVAVILPGLYASGHGRLGYVTMRVDDQKAFEARFGSANDHSALMQVSGEAIQIVKKLICGKFLFARVLTVNEPSIDVRFSLAGSDQAIAKVRSACGW